MKPLLPSAGLLSVLFGTHRPSTPGLMSDAWPCFIHSSVFPCTPGQCHPDDCLSNFSGLERSWYPVFLRPDSSKSSRVPMSILVSTHGCLCKAAETCYSIALFLDGFWVPPSPRMEPSPDCCRPCLVTLWPPLPGPQNCED